jgi:hypothetical protein
MSNKGQLTEYTHEWEVLVTRFHDLTDDQLLKLYISGLKPIICNELRLSRPKNLVEARSMAKMIKRKFISQQEVAFEPPKKTTSYKSSHYNNTKYHHLKRTKRRKIIITDVVRIGLQGIDVKTCHYTTLK